MNESMLQVVLEPTNSKTQTLIKTLDASHNITETYKTKTSTMQTDHAVAMSEHCRGMCILFSLHGYRTKIKKKTKAEV